MYLDDPHAEARVPRQLLPDVSGGLRRCSERRLQCLQLLGFYCCPRAASLTRGLLLVVVVAANVLIGQLSRLRVLPVVLRVLWLWGQTEVAGCRHWNQGKTKTVWLGWLLSESNYRAWIILLKINKYSTYRQLNFKIRLQNDYILLYGLYIICNIYARF